MLQGGPYLLLGCDLEGRCLPRAWEACGLLKAPSVPTCLPISWAVIRCVWLVIHLSDCP